MALHADAPRIAMQVSRNVVVASIQVDLDDDVLARFQEDLLDHLHSTGARGVIFEVSGLDVLDAEEFAALRRIMVMAGLMGAESALVGLQPGVASALIEADADVDGLHATSNIDAAFTLLLPETDAARAAEDEPTADEWEDDSASVSEPTPGAER